MRRSLSLLAAAFGLAVILAGTASASDMTDSLKKGTPELKSAGALAFGPEGILFVGDTASAAIFAIGTDDVKGDSKADVKVEKLNEKIGSMFGAASTDIAINDLKVNPASGNIYLSITRGKGSSATPVIVKVDRAGKITALELKDVPFSSVSLAILALRSAPIPSPAFATRTASSMLPVCRTKNSRRSFARFHSPSKRPTRGPAWKSSTERTAKLKPMHPVRTFTIYDIAGQTNLLASYTCTPLVTFPIDSLKPGAKVHGTTVAELGNHNNPLGMIVYTKEGKDYLLMSNTKHGVIKVKLEGIDKAKPITSRISETAGLTYDKFPEMKDVVQIDKLDSDRFVYHTLTKPKDGPTFETLMTAPLP